jgi:hypothetical protein
VVRVYLIFGIYVQYYQRFVVQLVLNWMLGESCTHA